MSFGRGLKRSAPHKLSRRVALAEHPVVRSLLANLPASVDLAKFQPAILDQGPTGSCTAHSTASAVATAFAAAGHPLAFVPSPREIYATTRALERAASTPAGATLGYLTDGGAELGDVFTALSQFGVCPIEAPTSDGRLSDVEPSNVNSEPGFIQLEQAALRPVVGPYGLDPTSSSASDTIAAALAAGIPVAIAAFVDTAFENLQPGHVAGAPNQADPQGGGHAIYLSGYQTQPDGSRAFILTNSWGVGWCNAGRCLVGPAWLAAAWEAWPVSVVVGVS